MSIASSQCHVFSDGDDRIVFIPEKGLLMRTDAAKAAELEQCAGLACDIDAQSWTYKRASVMPLQSIDTIIVTCGNQCRLQCRYCLSCDDGPEVVPDAEFYRLALAQILESTTERKSVKVGFLGVGEPTAQWQPFIDTVTAVEAVAREVGIPVHMSVCTDGQLSAKERNWLCEKMHRIDVSLDGSPDIQNRQRPRKDGCDSFVQPAALIREANAAGREVYIRTTVTEATVQHMTYFVDYFAEMFGKRVSIVFNAMTQLGNMQEGCSAPAPAFFVENFGYALDRACAIGVNVVHPVISVDTLLVDPYAAIDRMVCLLPNQMIARHSEPYWLKDAANNSSSVFGCVNRLNQRLNIDEDAFRNSIEGVFPQHCRSCVCVGACVSHPSSWGWNASHPGDRDCSIHTGLTMEVLKRLV